MQKAINVIALLSGLVSLTTVAGAVYLYKNADTMIEDVRGKVIEEVTEIYSKNCRRINTQCSRITERQLVM